MGRFSSWSSLPRLLYYTTTCSSPSSTSLIASTLHLRHFSAESVERLRHVWISGLIDPDKVGPKERSMLYAGKIEEMNASLNKEQPFREFDTIRAGITFVKWKHHKITVMDTSGSVDDFTDEVETALGAFDSGAIHVLSSIDGVQSHSTTIDKHMIRYDLPRLIFLNNIDHKGANPWEVLNQVRSELHRCSAAIQVPIGLEDDFKGLVDLVQLKAYYFHGSNGEKVVVEEVPADMEALVEEKRQELIENVAPLDDKLAEAFSMKKPISPTDLKEAVHRATITRRFIPVFMGSAFKYKGLQLLLDGVLNYLPCPNVASNYALEQSKNEEKYTLLALAFSFKMKYGTIKYLRINEGVIERGHFVVADDESFEVPELYRRYNDELEMIPEARAGEIVTVYEHCIDDDSYWFPSSEGCKFIDGLVRYRLLGIVRYPNPNASPKVDESWEDIKPPGRTSLKELMSGGINDIYYDPWYAERPILEIYKGGKDGESIYRRL
ncbi:elongation factor G-1, mitochondrial-like isoform X2 [Trifolium pratense]|uniref:elongation factor G-1, mitochondrial-like isoform X2 n=1 Tax=Trifolium pratense TaxID=57577 RepID=UPI001E6974F6|nr:elongation factor G-1, mitochondrial-like isoform X2 [Trifolium pratense]